MLSMVWSLAPIAVAAAILIDYEEVRDEYCSPANVSKHAMQDVEECFAIGSLDFGVRRLVIITDAEIADSIVAWCRD